MKPLVVLLFISFMAIGCVSKNVNEPLPANNEMQSQACTDSLGFSGRWKLVNIHDSGKNLRPTITDTLIISDCSTVELYRKSHLIRKDTFKLYRMINYCADYQLKYKNDSIGCINIVKDTLIFSECSDFETARFFYKRF